MKKKPGTKLACGDCLERLKDLPDDSVDTVITDPPYGLAFMGKAWDHGVPGVAFWSEVMRVAKPGAYLLAFGGTRTYHRLACAIEDAGWEIRDCVMWVYGCLSEDTEILINGRWEHYSKAIAGRLAMCYDIEHDKFTWQPIEDLFVYEYDDTAFRVVSDSTDQIISRNHRCIVERSGEFSFQFAEEAAREREARVPVLEGVSDLLCDLPVHDKRAGDEESVLREAVQGSKEGEDKAAGGAQRDGDCVRCLRRGEVEAERMAERSQEPNLLKTVQREAPRQTPNKTPLRPHRDEVPRHWIEGGEESGMEGRSHLLQKTRQLQAGEVCEVSGCVLGDGAKRRVRDGASVVCGDGAATAAASTRDCPSREPRPARQPTGESVSVCEQPGPQAVRASRYTRTDLARIEPIQYKGTVWCVKVPTGAFVARRNGKVFITGNSGFPKSHNIGKAIDKAAGATREVVGQRRGQGNIPNDRGKWGLEPNKPVDITAPATPEAQQWDGWGTALKPAYEIAICAQKPHSLRQLCVILAHRIGESVCQLQSHASVAEKSLASSQAEQSAGADSALWSALPRFNTPADLFEAMGTLRSASGLPSSLSTALSWLGTLGAIWSHASTFTTEMETGLTTDLKILNCSESAITPESIIGGATGQRGTGSSASLAGSILSAARMKLDATRTRSAAGSATSSASDLGLHPSVEPCIVARKPFKGTVAANVMQHGTGAINVDGCRVGTSGGGTQCNRRDENGKCLGHPDRQGTAYSLTYHGQNGSSGRWPANLIHDGSPEVVGLFPETKSGSRSPGVRKGLGYHGAYGDGGPAIAGDSGSAARFFYCAKASKRERNAGLEGMPKKVRNHHPTVKPISLMRYLARLTKTPTGGVVLDPFMGSGTTGMAAVLEGRNFIGVELDENYYTIAKKRIKYAKEHPEEFDPDRKPKKVAKKEKTEKGLWDSLNEDKNG